MNSLSIPALRSVAAGIFQINVLQPAIGIARFSSPALVPWSRLFLGLALLVASGIFTPAQAQFGNGYSFQREVDFVDAKVIGGAHTNYPVLIDSTLLDLRTVANGGKVENANGYDIIFTSDQAGASQLAHQIESYDAVTGKIVFWVRVESFVATTKIYLFYGNSSIATFQGDVTSNGVTGVWDNDYQGVWHLNEEQSGTGTDNLYEDATSNGNHGDDWVSAQGQDGAIGPGQQFDGGSSDYVGMGDVLDYGKNDPVTYSAWIKTSTAGTQIAGKAVPTGSFQGVWFYLDGSSIKLSVIWLRWKC